MRYEQNDQSIKELIELSDQFEKHKAMKETRDALIVGIAAIEYADQRGVCFMSTLSESREEGTDEIKTANKE